MNKEEKQFANNIADFWLNNCQDDDFYNNCMEEILIKLNHKEGPVPDKAYEIWKYIEKRYC